VLLYLWTWLERTELDQKPFEGMMKPSSHTAFGGQRVHSCAWGSRLNDPLGHMLQAFSTAADQAAGAETVCETVGSRVSRIPVN
jgi:hypothetical protein